MERTESLKVAITHLAMGIDAKVTHHVVAIKKVVEQQNIML